MAHHTHTPAARHPLGGAQRVHRGEGQQATMEMLGPLAWAEPCQQCPAAHGNDGKAGGRIGGEVGTGCPQKGGGMAVHRHDTADRGIGAGGEHSWGWWGCLLQQPLSEPPHPEGDESKLAFWSRMDMADPSHTITNVIPLSPPPGSCTTK